MHSVILSASIENGGHWPWPSGSFWLRVLGIPACPRNNFYWIWARITKFAPNMHLGILAVDIENGGNWPWSSRSFRLTKRHSTSLLYTHLGQPRGATRPKRALVSPTNVRLILESLRYIYIWYCISYGFPQPSFLFMIKWIEIESSLTKAWKIQYGMMLHMGYIDQLHGDWWQ